MKPNTIIPFLFLCVCVLFSCTPVNPPQTEDEGVQIVKTLYNGMGKPIGQTVESLTRINSLSESDMQIIDDEIYLLNTPQASIRIVCINGLVCVAQYTQDFRDIYAEGVKKFYAVDDAIYQFGWDQWIGGRQNVVKSLTNHEDLKADIDAYLKSQGIHTTVGIISMYADNDLLLNSTVTYLARSIDESNLYTGEGSDPMADNKLYVEFRM